MNNAFLWCGATSSFCREGWRERERERERERGGREKEPESELAALMHLLQVRAKFELMFATDSEALARL